jgi:hypothetical protein
LPQALAVFLTGMFGVGPVSLALQAIPALFMGALLWAIGEVLEIRLIPIDAAPAPRPAGRASPAAVLLGAVLLLAWGRWAFPTFRAFFQADIDHNVGIFFSKSGIWSKGPDFDAAAGNLPPDMREEYQRTGGALEHYKRVGRLNPNFPMAPYFVGNVYNDWGSGFYSRSAEARAQGRTGEAERLLAETNEVWDQAEKAYIQLKKFAPNYVQTHHQMGTLYLKRMEMDNALGKPDKAREDGVTALRHFELYRFLDPVYPPNFYRMAQIHSWMGDWDAAEEDYRGALKYNTANVVQRINPDRNVESYTNLGRLLLARLDRANPRGPLNAADPLFAKAAAAFESALGCFRDLGERPEFLRFALDAHKGLGVLYLRAGDRARASEHWGAVAAINPQDADLRRVTGR